jgi:multiple sugar transport system ATP-binding protein
MTLGDRIVIMKDGFIQQIGTPQEVFDHPANIFVAGFIGMPQMNFFDGQLVADGDGLSLKCMDAVMELPAAVQSRLKANGVGAQAVTLGIRPEHVSFSGQSGPHCLTGTVDVSEMMGSEIHLHVTCCGKDVVVRIPTTELEASQRGGLKYGESINITFPADLVHLFDPETEENLL